MADVLDRLARRSPVPGRVMLVAAHPDDETIGAGASLHLFEDLVLVHVTDGAPADLADAHAAGFADARAYAEARRRELRAALHTGGACPSPVVLDVPDQGASAAMHGLADRLAALFAHHAPAAVLTHAYEGGHPDHDATAFAVHAAARACTRPPALLEFAGYHAGSDGGMVVGRFLEAGPMTVVALDRAEQATKRRMLDCFVSQRATLAAFGVTHEAYRPAPAYDFAAPPHHGTLHYERFDWGMTGSVWRRLAGA